MRVLHTIASIRADHGGPTRNLTGLSSALSRYTTCEVTFLAMVPRNQRAKAIQRLNVRSWTLLDEVSVLKSRSLRSPAAFYKTLQELVAIQRPELIHDHGLWLPNNHFVARVARNKNIPRIVNLMGMATPWALGYRRLKKRAAWALYQRRDLKSASAIQSASEYEAKHIRALGLGVPIAVIPPGVTLPDDCSWPEENAEARALFLSRVHPKKNLETLIRAWAAVRPKGWTLRIVGPSELGYRQVLERLSKELGIADQVTFVGEIGDEEKWAEYRAARLFILPTLDENFGIVIPEALAAARPVITTTGTPWGVVAPEGCGWCVDPDLAGIGGALREATATSDVELKAMGLRGREFVRKRFSWEAVALSTVSVYQWVSHGGPVPSCVITV